VVRIGGESAELCGGTHIDSTSKIKLFKILSESSVAAGVRRIEAVTGDKALELIDGYKDILIRSAGALKISDYSELPRCCAAMASEIKTLEREINALNEKLAALRLESALSGMTETASGRVLTAKFENVSPDILRAMGDMIKDRYPDITAVLASVSGDGGSLLCVCGAEAVKNGKNAGKTVREIAALTGGKGGGRPESAMAGIGDKSKLDEALAILK
jgi:alanyl-tRNA synthetase